MLKYNISKQQLEDLYVNQKLSDAQIGQMFNVSLGIVHRLRGSYNIKTIEQYQRHHKDELDQEEKEFLTGTLLGDAHARWRKGNKTYPQIMFEQSVKHKEYMLWLKEKICDWIFDPDKFLKQTRKVKKDKVYHSYCINTVCHPVFEEFHKGFYINNKKVVKTNFIEQFLTPYSMAIWIMDDGTVSKKRNIAICTQSFNKRENEELSQLILDKFDIKSNLWKSYGDRYWLGFSKEDSMKLTDLIKDHVIPSMKYKLISSETTNGADNK